MVQSKFSGMTLITIDSGRNCSPLGAKVRYLQPWGLGSYLLQKKRGSNLSATTIILYSVCSYLSTQLIKSDLIERPSGRFLKVKNPWSQVSTFHSTFSMDELRDALDDGKGSDDDLISEPSAGIFWTNYVALARMFKTMYLNWNPTRFRFSCQKHFSFTPNGSAFDISSNAQFTVSVVATETIWFVARRHYLGKTEAWEGYIGLAVFSGINRMYTYSRPTYRVRPS